MIASDSSGQGPKLVSWRAFGAEGNDQARKTREKPTARGSRAALQSGMREYDPFRLRLPALCPLCPLW
jgi:hypothetical protein